MHATKLAKHSAPTVGLMLQLLERYQKKKKEKKKTASQAKVKPRQTMHLNTFMILFIKTNWFIESSIHFKANYYMRIMHSNSRQIWNGTKMGYMKIGCLWIWGNITIFRKISRATQIH